MISRIAAVCLGLVLLVLPVLGLPASAATTGNSAAEQGALVSPNPDDNTPAVVDGTVLSMAQVGNLVVVGGQFTGVRDAGSSAVLPRSNIFAYDVTTKKVSTTFVPNPRYLPSGSPATTKASYVYKVLPAADGTSVYVGGDFGTLTAGGADVSVPSRLVKLTAASGALDTTFAPGTLDGQVRDLELTGSRLWVAGKFTYVQGKPRRALVSLSATTGKNDGFFTDVFSGQHRSTATYKDITSVLGLTTTPDNKKLVVTGNFKTLTTTGGVATTHEQIAMYDISGSQAVLANWYTTMFTSPCSASFESYVTDAAFSVDGSYLVVSTTGGYAGQTSGCDVVARFETAATGQAVQPSWSSYTGGDTTWTVEVTRDVVYVGGHQRWQNNPAANNKAGQGAVSREGIAALDPVNGLPYTWNPTRTRGVGIKDMLATADGLYVGSDTTVFANETHERLAFLPVAGGEQLPTATPVSLPATVITSDGTTVQQRTFDGANVTSGPSPVPDQATFANGVGAFMIGKTLYVAYRDGTLKKGRWDGTAYTEVSTVATADQLVRQADWHDTDVPSLTSLFYSAGRIYFTRSGQNLLFSRGFEPESDVVGQIRTQSAAPSGISYSDVRGAFVADGRYYYARSNGSLYSMTWNGSAPSGTVITYSSAGSTWASKVTFLYPGALGAAPTASYSADCGGRSCTFDAAGSRDPDGSISSYAWDFGDGGTGSGSTVDHSYVSDGTYTVTLTVTDGDGLTGQASRTVTAEDVSSDVSFVDTATSFSSGGRTKHTVTVSASAREGDQLLLFLTGNSTNATYSTPSGWTLTKSLSGDTTTGLLLSRTATGDDAGSTVTIDTGTYVVKDVMTLAAYRGGDLTDASAQLDTADRTTRTTPTVSAPDGHQWLVSYWSDKGSSTSAWSIPDQTTRRTSVFGTGSGHTSSVLGDSGAAVASGSQGGLQASSDVAGGTGATFSVLIG